MAHSLSARKRIRQNRTRRLRNRSFSSALKTQAKQLVSKIDMGDIDGAQSDMPGIQKKFMQVAAKGVMHRNRARRKISRLARRINRARTEQAVRQQS